MCAQAISEEDRSALLIAPRSAWRTRSVWPLGDFSFWVEFLDGTTGTVDMKDFVHAVHADDAGVFAVLRDPARFGQVFVDYGAVTWPGEIDLAPDAMYQAIQATGRWVVS